MVLLRRHRLYVDKCREIISLRDQKSGCLKVLVRNVMWPRLEWSEKMGLV